MIAIIGAMAQEIEILKEQLQHKEEQTIAHIKLYRGQLAEQEVVLLQSGIGKVNAAIATTVVLSTFNISHVINTGSAGGIDIKLAIGDVVIANNCIYHDADATAFGYQIGQIPQMPEYYACDLQLIEQCKQVMSQFNHHYLIGQIATGDSFIATNEMKNHIKDILPDVLAIDMEATAIAQTCHQFKTPFIITRAISDLANHESEMSFDEFLPIAAKHSSQVVKALVEKI